MMSSPIKRITHQYKVSLIWIAALFISSLFLFASLLWESADTINQEDEKHVHSSIEEDIQRTKRLLLNNVRDYAIWDSAYDQWIKQQQPDRDWVVSNLGTGLYENLNVEWAAVVSQSQGIRFSAYQGKTHSAVMSQKLAPLTQALLRQGSDLLLLDNKVYAVASHPILKESDNHDAAGYGESFVFVTPLNTAEQHELKTHIGYQDLHFSLQPPPSHAYYSLQDNQGKQLGYLNWQPMKPGNQFLHHLFPWILLLLTVLGITTGLLFHRLVKQGRHSLQEMQALANTRSDLEEQQKVVQNLRQRFQYQGSQQTFFHTLSLEATRLIKADITAVWLLDDSGHQLVCQTSNSSMTHEAFNLSEVQTCIELIQGQPVVELNMPGTDRPDPFPQQGMLKLFREFGLHSALLTGVYQGGELQGVLTFCQYQPRQWSDSDKNAASALAGVTAQFAEAFQRRKAEENFYQETHFDQVTGLPQLAHIEDQFSQETEHKEGYLLILRLHGLHLINEFHGVEAGDEVFRNLAQQCLAILEPLPQQKHLFRLPANRLGLLLEGSQSEAEHSVQLLIDLVSGSTWDYQRKNYTLSLQAGGAHYPSDGRSLEELQHKARLALQHIRNQADKPNTFSFYSLNVSRGLKARTQAIQELQRAIEREEFVLYFQPQYSSDKRIEGAEVLLRWQHPEKGLLGPGHFITLAEETELIVPMSRWILRQACQVLTRLPITLSVNISVLQLRQAGFVREIQGLIHEFDFQPHQLVIEIVESMMADPGAARQLKALRQLGVQVALDDFGTGYSSLSYLQHFAVDEIKVDQCFIKALEEQDDAPLARTIIAMAHSLNCRVVVEGVENKAQLAFCRQHKADLIQGFFFAKPEPWEHFTARLEASFQNDHTANAH